MHCARTVCECIPFILFLSHFLTAKTRTQYPFLLFYIFTTVSRFLFHYLCSMLCVVTMTIRRSIWFEIPVSSHPFATYWFYISSSYVLFGLDFRPTKQINGVQTWTRNSHPFDVNDARDMQETNDMYKTKTHSNWVHLSLSLSFFV